MSTTIDQRVVEMRFDKEHFEKNVQSTMSLLDRLKKSLNLTGASKGLENVGTAAKNVKLEGLGSAADTVGLKFNAMYTMADQALRNITNRVQQTAEHMVSALTIDPIKTGFSEYETQINAVQTILANTESKGTNLDQVNAALDELNTYADKTIYNFTEMTRNIGTFTAAGVDLDKSVQSIKGIANLAAVSGSSSQQASTAMYQLSQALAAGKVSLMDWNSVVNAGMGGELFQNALIRTSELLGTGAKQAIKTYGTFRESLTQGEWLTAEVLTETLAQLSGAYSKADLIAQGFTEEQAAEIDKLANTAVNAATKVKTFTQLWDTLKESAQSGWTQTWELIVGDFEESKSLWTGVSDALGGIINATSESRNKLLEGALTSNWDKLIKKVNEAGVSTDDFNSKLQKVLEDGGAPVDRYIEKYGSLQEAFQQGAIDSKWLKKTIDELNGSLYDLGDIEGVFKKGSTGDEVKKIQGALEKLGYSLDEFGVDGIIGSETEAAIKAFQEAKGLKVDGIIGPETLAALEKAGGLTDGLIKGVDDLIDGIDKLGGRELLIESFKNVWAGLKSVIKPVIEAFRAIFPAMKPEKLYDIIKSFNEFTKTLSVSDETAGNIKKTFKGLFSVIKIVATIVGGALKIAFKIGSKAVSFFGKNILKITGAIGNVFTFINNFIQKVRTIGTVTDEMLDGFASGLKDGGKRVWSAITEFANTVINTIRKFLGMDTTEEIGGNVTAGFVNGLVAGAQKVWAAVVAFASKVITTVCDILGIHSPSTVMYEIGSFVVQGLANGISDGIKWLVDAVRNIADTIVKYFDEVQWDNNLIDTFITGFTELKDFVMNFDYSKLLAIIPIGALGIIIKKVYDIATGLSGGLTKFSDILDSVKNVIDGFEDTGKHFNKVLKAWAFNERSEGLKNIAIAIAILVGSVIALTFVDTDKLYDAVSVLIVLAGVLALFAIAMNKMTDTSIKLEKGKLNIDGLKASLIGIGVTMLLLAATVKMVGSLDPEKAKRGFLGLAGMATGMLVFVAALSLLAKNKKAFADVKQIGSMMIKLSIAMMLMIGVCKLIGTLDAEDAINGIAFATAFTLFVTSITKVAKSSGNNVSKVGGMILKLSIAMGMMVGVVKLIGMLSVGEMIKGGIFAAAFVTFVAVLTKVTKIGKKQQIAKIGGLVLSISMALMFMVGVCKLAGMLSVEDMVKGGIVAVAFVGLVAAMVKILTIGNEQKLAKVGSTILAMSIGIGIMAGIAILLSMVPLEGLAKGVAAVGILGLVMAAMVASTKGANNVKGNLIAMSVAIGIMAISVAALSFIDGKKLAGATTALSVLMGMFALMSKMAGSMNKALGSILVMGLVVGGLAVILGMLAKHDMNSSINSAVAMSIVLIALGASMKIMSGCAGVSVKALGAMGIMALIVGGLGVILGLLNKYDLNPSIESATALSVLLLAMSGACVILGAVGPLAAQAILGAATLAAVILILGGLVVAIGALVTEIPQLETFLDNGIPALEKIGEGIGKFVGGVIGGIGEGISDSLPDISKNLTEFINNFADIDSGAIEGAKSLVEVLGAIGLTTVGTTLSDIFTFGGTSMEKFQTDGVAFFDAMKEISTAATGITVDAESMKAVIDVATELAALQESLEPIGGVISWFTGRDDLGTFGENAGSFISSMSTALSSLTDLKYNSEALSAIISATTELSNIQSSLEPIGGVVTWFSGRDDLGTFGTNILLFIQEMKAALGSLGEDFTFNKEALTAIIEASTSLATLQESLEPIGGVISWFTGRDDLGTFGLNAGLFILSMKTVLESLGEDFTFNKEALTAIITAATELATLQQSLEPIGGVVDWFTGRDDLGTFGESVAKFGEAMGALRDGMGENGISENVVASMTNAGNALIALNDALPEKGWFDSKEDLTDFSTHIKSFAEALASFSETASGMNAEGIDVAISAANRIRRLIDAIADLDTSGVEAFTGVGSGGVGADGVVSDIAEAMAAFSEKVAGIDTAAVSTSVSAALKLKTFINGLTDLDTSGINNFKIGSIATAIKSYSNSVAGMDTSTVSSSISVANRLKNFIVSLAGIDTSGVGSFKSAISSLSNINIDSITKSFNGASSKFSEVGSKLIISLDKGMQSRKSTITATTTSILSSMYKAITSKLAMFQAAGITLMARFVAGIISQKGRISTVMNSSISSAVSGIRGHYNSMYNAGNYLGNGLVLGIKAKETAVYNAAYKLGQKAVQGEKDGQESNSPSKATIKAGKWFGEGLIIGIDNMSNKVYDSGNSLGKTAVGSISSAIAKVSDVVSNGIDTQPTIRPVLDLSEVEAGAGTIGGMFGNGLSLGLSTVTAGNIASSMNNRIQNGTTNDVISAIDKLRKDLGNVGGTSYNVNGITYDDGSNVATAIKSLIHAAKIDRRV